MKTYTYPLLTKIIYQYANIPITIILLWYLFVAVNGLSSNWVNLIPTAINMVLLYVMNRFYFRIYRIFPFKIEAINDGIMCSDFPFSKKIVRVKFEDIDEITGGIFSGVEIKPVIIHDSKNNVIIAFSTRLRDFKGLLSIIFSKIRKDVYKKSLEKFTQFDEDFREKQKDVNLNDR